VLVGEGRAGALRPCGAGVHLSVSAGAGRRLGTLNVRRSRTGSAGCPRRISILTAGDARPFNDLAPPCGSSVRAPSFSPETCFRAGNIPVQPSADAQFEHPAIHVRIAWPGRDRSSC
jgi:hypothetical protein